MLFHFHFSDSDSELVQGVTSKDPKDKSLYGSFNLATHVGDDLKSVLSNRNQLAEELGISVQQLVFAEQTHTSNVAVVSSYTQKIVDSDAMLTNVPGICLAILTADCVPILLFDPVKKAVGVVHAGWKGTVREIVKKSILKLQSEYDTNPKDILVGVGPCISEEEYEVGKEVALQFPADCLVQLSEEKYTLDLIKANVQQLIASGVLIDNIEIMNLCTVGSGRFYSARRDGIKSGRFSSFVMLK